MSGVRSKKEIFESAYPKYGPYEEALRLPKFRTAMEWVDQTYEEERSDAAIAASVPKKTQKKAKSEEAPSSNKAEEPPKKTKKKAEEPPKETKKKAKTVEEAPPANFLEEEEEKDRDVRKRLAQLDGIMASLCEKQAELARQMATLGKQLDSVGGILESTKAGATSMLAELAARAAKRRDETW
jgi:HD-GYP domain-containing protein (c-di-GMP phosphodiesterase class II)